LVDWWNHLAQAYLAFALPPCPPAIAAGLLLLLQTVLGAFLPISLLAALFPSRISCRAYELPASHLYSREHHHSGAVFTPAAVRIKAQQAAKHHPLSALLSQVSGMKGG
jgi:hypothetical protein